MVVTAKLTEVAPEGTVTDAGTEAAGELHSSAMGRPPLGAAELIVTVPVDVLPPKTAVGFNATETSEGGLTVSVAVAFPGVAVNVTAVCVETGTVGTLKLAEVCPAGTWTESELTAEVSLLVI